MKEEAELRECTFKPNLGKKKLKGKGSHPSSAKKTPQPEPLPAKGSFASRREESDPALLAGAQAAPSLPRGFEENISRLRKA